MGYMEEGNWRVGDAGRSSGTFVRQPSRFRNRIAKASIFEPAPGRYHLYASLACPWASRAVLVRKLKRLEHCIPMTLVRSTRESGWTLEPDGDPVNGASYIYEIYRLADPLYSGRATVPILWDTKTSTIVNNESAEIISMLNDAFAPWSGNALDLYPAQLAEDIDGINELVYQGLNNAVYRAGFSTSQAAYEEAVAAVFSTLSMLEERLETRRFLLGSQMTLADVRLFTTGIRFDLVYFSHFKCNARRWADYPNLWNWLRDMYQFPGVAETVDFAEIKHHYYANQRWVNPSGVVPVGPHIDFGIPHSRATSTNSSR